MSEKALRYLELIAEKEWHRATNKLTRELALRYASHLERIWNDLSEDEQLAVDAELTALDERPIGAASLGSDSSDPRINARQAA